MLTIFHKITFISIHWRLQKFIHSSDTVFHAAGWSSNLQGDGWIVIILYNLYYSHTFLRNVIDFMPVRSTQILLDPPVLFIMFIFQGRRRMGELSPVIEGHLKLREGKKVTYFSFSVLLSMFFYWFSLSTHSVSLSITGYTVCPRSLDPFHIAGYI